MAKRANDTDQTQPRLMAALRETFVIILTTASGATTYVGAQSMFSASWVIALLLTLGIQIGLFVTGHDALRAPRNRRDRSRPVRLVPWLMLVGFSIWASVIGAFSIVSGEVARAHEHGAVADVWRAARRDLSRFKTEATASVVAEREKAVVNLMAARSVIAGKRLPARRSLKAVQLSETIKGSAAALEALGKVPVLDAEPPESSTEARQRLNSAFEAAAAADAVLPADVRASYPLPAPVVEREVAGDVQTRFLIALSEKDPRALQALLLAIALDALPLAVRYVASRSRPVPKRIRSARRWLRAVRRSVTRPLPTPRRSFVVELEDSDVTIAFTVAEGERGLYLRDLERVLPDLETALAAETPYDLDIEAMQFESLTGVRIVPDVPLADQVPDGILRLVHAEEGDDDEVAA